MSRYRSELGNPLYMHISAILLCRNIHLALHQWKYCFTYIRICYAIGITSMWGIIELWEHDRQSSHRLRCNEKHDKVFWARYGARPAIPLVVSNATGFSNHWNLVATCYIQQPNLTLKSPLPKYRKTFSPSPRHSTEYFGCSKTSYHPTS